jgi:hypothetical protein
LRRNPQEGCSFRPTIAMVQISTRLNVR